MTVATDRKLTLIGGGGVRTPLVTFGVNDAAQALGARELVLWDPDADRLAIMAALGRAIVKAEGGELIVREATSIEDAVEGAAFVMNSIRVGGIAGRAADERTAIDHGFPGQETTGPAGAAMALRTVPIAIEQARLVERLSPDGWIVNFTNPAGLITQAISDHTDAKVVGICDTPTELFHNIAHALGATLADVECDYVGLNHLGWVRGIRLHGEDVFDRVLADDAVLDKLYSAPVFDKAMIRALRLIPTEYLFFYYERRRALANQCKHGSSRGTEVEALNVQLIATLRDRLGADDGASAIAAYAAYLNRRSGSYMKLEAEGGSAFDPESTFDIDPFRVASGYHRIAIDVMSALTGAKPATIVVNTRNRGALPDLPERSIVETSSRIERDAITPLPIAALPDPAIGLVHGIKAYERAAIEAALTGERPTARKALLIHPAIGEWDPTGALLADLLDPTCQHC
ncbi:MULTISPECIES: family 4 glycosyl hydrolase [unclassified Sphingomonas]|uniref:family 4 glycosyl hydrolase n=1 Tax=unclassified Sphingomonas TaxID=196159 RepID=UPI0006FB5641|nr:MULTISPECIES: 6-phospho-beta-glucosidase [unclassified Sphingomonas]KQM61409.1 6-phospho-beta-glucosidase [Sphingomonas sp. Leaf16]KQN12504.1 6-phospho-beta-glucosidase [Sphingomonas sp. Leaf29]KQN18984.1 6-phospho-beta-glucosidase [Sphingomonas sp. Leaf32]